MMSMYEGQEEDGAVVIPNASITPGMCIDPSITSEIPDTFCSQISPLPPTTITQITPNPPVIIQEESTTLALQE